MATKFLIRGGKILKQGVLWDDGTGGKLKLLKWALIGDEYQVMDLSARTLTDYTVARSDATGSAGDRVDPVDMAELG